MGELNGNEGMQPDETAPQAEAPGQPPQEEELQQEAPSPCVRTRVAIDAALQKRVSKTARRVLLCLMLVGIAMLIAYVVLSVIAEMGVITLSDDFWLEILLWGGAVFFAFGLVFFITSGRVNKKQLALAFVNEYEFCAEGVVINDYRAGEHVSTARLRYSDFEKIRENREFFLLYPNRVTVYPVDKTVLTPEERALLRTFLRLPARQDRV